MCTHTGSGSSNFLCILFYTKGVEKGKKKEGILGTLENNYLKTFNAKNILQHFFFAI